MSTPCLIRAEGSLVAIRIACDGYPRGRAPHESEGVLPWLEPLARAHLAAAGHWTPDHFLAQVVADWTRRALDAGFERGGAWWHRQVSVLGNVSDADADVAWVYIVRGDGSVRFHRAGS